MRRDRPLFICWILFEEKATVTWKKAYKEIFGEQTKESLLLLSNFWGKTEKVRQLPSKGN